MKRHRDRTSAAYKQLLNWVVQDKLKPILITVFQLENAAKAHQAILDRKTTGKVILTLPEN